MSKSVRLLGLPGLHLNYFQNWAAKKVGLGTGTQRARLPVHSTRYCVCQMDTYPVEFIFQRWSLTLYLTYTRHSLTPAHLGTILDLVSEHALWAQMRSCCSLDSDTAARREDIVFLVSQTELYWPREGRHQYDWCSGQGLVKQAGPVQERTEVGEGPGQREGEWGADVRNWCGVVKGTRWHSLTSGFFVLSGKHLPTC